MKNESVSWIIYHLCFDLHSGIWLRSDLMGSSCMVESLRGCTLIPLMGSRGVGILRLPRAPPFHRSINYKYDLGRFLCNSSICGRDDKASLSSCGILWINSYAALCGNCHITCLVLVLLFSKPGSVCLGLTLSVWLCVKVCSGKAFGQRSLYVFTWASLV